jgi:hypothetical protein
MGLKSKILAMKEFLKRLQRNSRDRKRRVRFGKAESRIKKSKQDLFCTEMM